MDPIHYPEPLMVLVNSLPELRTWNPSYQKLLGKKICGLPLAVVIVKVFDGNFVIL